MEVEKAVNSLKAGLMWGNWSKEQADAVRTVLIEVEKVKLLGEENAVLRRRVEEANK